MASYFERLVDFVGAHPQLSFLAVFLLALSEAVPVIGTVCRAPRSSYCKTHIGQGADRISAPTAALTTRWDLPTVSGTEFIDGG
jgi:hypothetical protein